MLLLSIVGRVIFLFRAIGADFKLKISVGFELAAFFLFGVGIIFTKGTIDWINILLYVLWSLGALLVMWIDDTFYLYIVEDDIIEE